MVIRERIEVGDILSFTQYVRNFTQQINQLSQVMNTVQSAVAASERVFDFLNLKEEVQELENPLSIEGLNGNIEFDHVSFGYNKNKVIIHDFCAKVKDGQKIAIVGPTGAGKTTIVKLLMRFYELNSGRILIGSAPVMPGHFCPWPRRRPTACPPPLGSTTYPAG